MGEGTSWNFQIVFPQEGSSCGVLASLFEIYFCYGYKEPATSLSLAFRSTLSGNGYKEPAKSLSPTTRS